MFLYLSTYLQDICPALSQRPLPRDSHSRTFSNAPHPSIHRSVHAIPHMLALPQQCSFTLLIYFADGLPLPYTFSFICGPMHSLHKYSSSFISEYIPHFAHSVTLQFTLHHYIQIKTFVHTLMTFSTSS